jgi:hypothetical protein
MATDGTKAHQLSSQWKTTIPIINNNTFSQVENIQLQAAYLNGPECFLLKAPGAFWSLATTQITSRPIWYNFGPLRSNKIWLLLCDDSNFIW